MIKAEELRIGSKVAMGVHHCTVNSIHTVPQTGECFVRISGFLDKDPQYQVYLYQLEPIPLTPEILEACGFIKHSDSLYFLNFSDKDYTDTLLVQLDKYWWWSVDSTPSTAGEEGSKWRQVEFLHDLQNIAFPITRKELTYTPETEKA